MHVSVCDDVRVMRWWPTLTTIHRWTEVVLARGVWHPRWARRFGARRRGWVGRVPEWCIAGMGASARPDMGVRCSDAGKAHDSGASCRCRPDEWGLAASTPIPHSSFQLAPPYPQTAPHPQADS